MSDRDRRPQCPEHLRLAFLGEPKYVQLAPGEHLYKLVSLPIVRHRILESPWWIRQKTFDELQRRARGLQKSVAELTRSQMAITHEWNPGMDTMYIVVLTAQVDGWEGRARSQPVSLTDRTVAFTGGGDQFAVAGLTWQQIGVNYSGWPPQ